MASKMLKLNKDKTELTVFFSKQHMKKNKNLRINVGSCCIYFSMSLRNLGLTLDNTVGLEKHVNSKCMSCYQIPKKHRAYS